MASDDRGAASDGDGCDRVMAALVQQHANRVVADLLGEGELRHRLESLCPTSDSEFTQDLVDRELGLIADGVDPVRIRLRLAVLRTARDVLATCVAIHRLPETPPSGRDVNRSRPACESADELELRYDPPKERGAAG